MVGLVALESGSKRKLKSQPATFALVSHKPGKPTSVTDTKLGSFLACCVLQGLTLVLSCCKTKLFVYGLLLHWQEVWCTDALEECSWDVFCSSEV